MKYFVYNKYTETISDGGLADSKEAAIEEAADCVDAGQGDPSDFVIYEVTQTFTYVPPADRGTLVPMESFR